MAAKWQDVNGVERSTFGRIYAMKGKSRLSLLGLAASGTLVLALLLVTGGTAGEYHAGNSLYCYDCHTMHFSMQHNWNGTTPVSTTGAIGGNWLSATGPNQFLLKAPVNQLCMACHDGRSFAPDVFGANSNASPTKGREAGALNDSTNPDGYQTWMGHTLGSTNVPPGYNPSVVGLTNWYDSAAGLACTGCHIEHGSPLIYRNLGPRALGTGATGNLPHYTIGTSNVTSTDVWINLASYTAGSGVAGTFNPYYDTANIVFNRNDQTVGSTRTSNHIDTMCAACHGDFHGGPGDTGIGASPVALDGFIRHPTSQATIGSTAGGHSSLVRYVGGITKVKVYTTDYSGYTNASPGCVTCHKGHGNKNPFSLIFLNRDATGVNEEGGYATGQSPDVPTGYRNLCGQCHNQGN